MTVDPAHTVAFLQRREAARQRGLDARFRTAWADFDRIVEMIVREFAPRRVWQWGSLLHRRHFSSRSDIGIAVEGLGPAERLFRLYARAEDTWNDLLWALAGGVHRGPDADAAGEAGAVHRPWPGDVRFSPADC